jgi:YhcH/YjgK/YiaL family protein
MIYDELSNLETYRHVKPGIALALDYLKKTDFTDVPNGKYELDGDKVYALVQRYKTKPLAESVWESHRQKIDVQFVFRGEERFGYVPLSKAPAVTQPYDEKTDAALYAPGTTTVPLKAGQFAVFFPQDIHAPCLAENDLPSEVIKVVVKVAV